RDKGVLFIFRQALLHNSPLVRRLGCIGLGAYGDPEAAGELSNALKDSDPDVQLAAGLALAALGTEKALDEMMQCLFDGEQSLRRAVSEALAGIPGIGHATLREAIGNQQDMMMRYAAVFGLARIKAAWSLALLYRTLLEDQEWYVRNAAEQAFRDIEDPELGGVTRRPEADALPWLITWAANRGEGVPAGPNARQMLIRALQEGEPPLRAVAARTLADMGHVQALKPLYNALRDRDENVRGAVHEALASLQTRLGTPLPLVN
ncbi:MAG: HEAT repeat domain-containing protein, partial [Anaerolineae bacterium]|nr:HEAT repeat domain-containing protein [Anaerolineae bacterium]